jgi:DNA-3-methyladenine glycosylase
MRLGRTFFARPSLEVAPALLGQVLVVEGGGGRVAVRITEVEAYAGEDDPGSHAFRGRTPRNEVMYGAAGHLYVYFTYGMHWCANIVCGRTGEPTAVLLRAGKVVDGLTVARARRPAAKSDRDLARGPARLASALALSGSDNGADLCARRGPGRAQWMNSDRTPDAPATVVATGPRVGVSGPGGDAAAYPWRFWLDGDPTVSTYRPAKPRPRR